MADEDNVAAAGTAGTSTSTLLNLARGAKGIALLCFLLPWVTVSCAGQPLARITGIQLATGSVSPISPSGMPGAPSGGAAAAGPDYGLDVFALAAAILIVVALVLTFVLARRQAALLAMAASAVAAVLIVFDVFVRIKGAATDQIRQGAASNSGPSGAGADFDRQMQQMVNSVSVDPAIGFWLCIIALIAAIVLCNMVRTRPGGV